MSCPHTNIELCFKLECDMWEDYSPECFLAYHGEVNHIAQREADHGHCNGTFDDGKDKTKKCSCPCHNLQITWEFDHCDCPNLLNGHEVGCPNRGKWKRENRGLS